MATVQNNGMYGVSIQFKYKNAAQWGNDEVLLAGEIGLELDTKKYKLGDGSTAWNQLAYYSNPTTDALVTALTERVGTAESSLSSLGTRLDTAEADISQAKSDITAHGNRLDTAEGNITSQGTRLDTAEGNITSQGTRLTTAEGDIDAVEGRMDTAEADIDAVEADVANLKGITVISANPAPNQGA